MLMIKKHMRLKTTGRPYGQERTGVDERLVDDLPPI